MEQLILQIALIKSHQINKIKFQFNINSNFDSNWALPLFPPHCKRFHGDFYVFAEKEREDLKFRPSGMLITIPQ